MGSCTISMTLAGSVRKRPFGITPRVPTTASGTMGSPAWIASMKLPPLNLATCPSQLRVPSAKMMSDSPSETSARQRLNARAIGIPAIDEQVAAAFEVPAEHRKPRERFLRDDPQLVRQRREDDGDVVDALVVRDEDVGPARLDAFESLDRDADAGRLQDQPRPRARAPVSEVA